MGVQLPPADDDAGRSHAPELQYGTTTVLRTRVLAWVALGFALLGALVVAIQLRIVLGEAAAQGRFEWVALAGHFLLPGLAILLALFGWRRDAKRWATLAAAIATLSILALLLLSSRTWGNRAPGGESRWHWPRVDWRV